ncbi:MAG: gamma-glutamylcyclotransferase [Hyphomicrobiaceae bacterium]
MPHRVFVYGTLKRGFPNHGLMRAATFIDTALTVERYPMILQGRGYSPVMMPEPGNGHRIVGEVWEVDDAQLVVLDDLESTHLPTGYIRETIAVETPAGTISAFVYFKPRGRVTIVHSEPHADYQHRGYIPPELRQP